MEQSLISELRARFPQVECLENEPMSKYTSFRVGGPAAVLLQPGTAEETEGLLAFLRERDIRFFVMGNGTNLLFPDEGYEGAVVRTARRDALRDLGGGCRGADQGQSQGQNQDKADELLHFVFPSFNIFSIRTGCFVCFDVPPGTLFDTYVLEKLAADCLCRGGKSSNTGIRGNRREGI